MRISIHFPFAGLIGVEGEELRVIEFVNIGSHIFSLSFSPSFFLPYSFLVLPVLCLFLFISFLLSFRFSFLLAAASVPSFFSPFSLERRTWCFVRYNKQQKSGYLGMVLDIFQYHPNNCTNQNLVHGNPNRTARGLGFVFDV